MFLAARTTCDGFTVPSLGHESASRVMSAALFGRPSASRQALHSSIAVHIFFPQARHQFCDEPRSNASSAFHSLKPRRMLTVASSKERRLCSTPRPLRRPPFLRRKSALWNHPPGSMCMSRRTERELTQSQHLTGAEIRRRAAQSRGSGPGKLALALGHIACHQFTAIHRDGSTANPRRSLKGIGRLRNED
jgi:hypothetical protein